MFKISDIKFPDIKILDIYQNFRYQISRYQNSSYQNYRYYKSWYQEIDEKSKFLTLFAASTHVKMIAISKTNFKLPKRHTFFSSMFIEKPICSVKAWCYFQIPCNNTASEQVIELIVFNSKVVEKVNFKIYNWYNLIPCTFRKLIKDRP